MIASVHGLSLLFGTRAGRVLVNEETSVRLFEMISPRFVLQQSYVSSPVRMMLQKALLPTHPLIQKNPIMPSETTTSRSEKYMDCSVSHPSNLVAFYLSIKNSDSSIAQALYGVVERLM
ncbi:hypothetical protein [Paenibacillus profundus]|nr:hypothetical protein [Paenibacillus profundus]